MSPWSIQWLTWITHFVIAGLGTWVFAQFDMDPWRAASYMAWAYLFREGDQLSRKLWKRFVQHRRVTFNWLDTGLDAVSAVAGASLVAWWLS